MTYPKNPSFDTRILGAYNRILRRINGAVVNKLIEVQDRLDWSIRTDLDDEADDLRTVIADCNKAKAQAEDRLTKVLAYLDPDGFYGGFTPRPQVPEGAGLAADEDDAPQGYRAVAFESCAGCAFVSRPCPQGADGLLLCNSEARDDEREVHFLKRG